MTAAEKDKAEARDELRARLKPGMEVLCVLRHVSRSGMQRVIDLKILEDGELRGIGWTAARALGDRYDTKRDGIVTNGCGMDMGFALVYNLGAVLWREGFDCIEESDNGARHGCPSNDHSNRWRFNPETGKHEDQGVPKHHQSGGYALRSRWI